MQTSNELLVALLTFDHFSLQFIAFLVCFDAPTKYVNEHGFDGHIVLTDLMAPKPVPSKCQRMWMTTKNYAARPYFSTNERIIAIDG